MNASFITHSSIFHIIERPLRSREQVYKHECLVRYLLNCLLLWNGLRCFTWICRIVGIILFRLWPNSCLLCYKCSHSITRVLNKSVLIIPFIPRYSEPFLWFHTQMHMTYLWFRSADKNSILSYLYVLCILHWECTVCGSQCVNLQVFQLDMLSG